MKKTEIFLLGTKITDVSLETAVSEILDMVNGSLMGRRVFTPNPEMLVFGYSRKWFRRIFEYADLCIPDGFGLKIGARILGKKVVHRVTGVDLTEKLLHEAEHKGLKVVFVGGDDAIGIALLHSLEKKYPQLSVRHIEAGAISIAGEPLDTPDLVSAIAAESPDLAFICFGHPKQEAFIEKYRKQCGAKVLLGVGGTIDFLAGKITRAPKWMRRLGLEWLYRLLRQPSRIKRILTAVIIFPLLSLRWKIGSTFIYRKNVAGLLYKDGEILIGQHAKTGFWQIPQGGMKKGESYEEALYREVGDEAGTINFTIEGIVKNCYKYEWKGKYAELDKFKGQKQSVGLLRYNGEKADITMSRHEFTAHEWVSVDTILEDPRIPDFKKTIIRIVLKEFNLGPYA